MIRVGNWGLTGDGFGGWELHQYGEVRVTDPKTREKTGEIRIDVIKKTYHSKLEKATRHALECESGQCKSIEELEAKWLEVLEDLSVVTEKMRSLIA